MWSLTIPASTVDDFDQTAEMVLHREGEIRDAWPIVLGPDVNVRARVVCLTHQSNSSAIGVFKDVRAEFRDNRREHGAIARGGALDERRPVHAHQQNA